MFVGFIKQSFINSFGVSEVMKTEITVVNWTFASNKELFENTWTACPFRHQKLPNHGLISSKSH